MKKRIKWFTGVILLGCIFTSCGPMNMMHTPHQNEGLYKNDSKKHHHHGNHSKKQKIYIDPNQRYYP